MILIADSGSTKTQWALVKDGSVVKELFTKGINPFYQTEEEIRLELSTVLMPQVASEQIQAIYFYGAGCSFPEKKRIVQNALNSCLPEVPVEIESDMLGAARALFQREKGIACILGTGSNSCYYDGLVIVDNVSPLGYILGDEGSGAVLGKYLIADALKNQLPIALKEKLLEHYALSPAVILENVYKKPFPNRFLAQFTPFLVEHLEEPAIFNLVFDAFDSFFVRNVMQYELEEMEIGFVGSVAHFLRDPLEIVACERGITISSIVQSPMEGLVIFHS